MTSGKAKHREGVLAGDGRLDVGDCLVPFVTVGGSLARQQVVEREIGVPEGVLPARFRGELGCNSEYSESASRVESG